MGSPRARSFGNAVDHYERGRPVWPVAAVEAARVPPDAEHVLDLAAGTGKLTRVLAGRFPRVTAVEPDDAMRARNRWGRVLAGTAEAIPLPDASVDAVFVAEAFHWFCDAPAVAEIARVLRPAGRLALLWTRSEGDWEPQLPAVDALFARLRETAPGGAAGNLFATHVLTGAWRRELAAGPFGAFRSVSVPHPQTFDRGTLLAYLLSQSSIAARPERERAAIAAELDRLVPVGRYRLPLRVVVHTADRLREQGV